MCHGPSLQAAIDDHKVNVDAVNAAIQQAEDQLKNTTDVGKNYINQNTKGIIGDSCQLIKSESYSKFSEEYSLDKLDGVVDGVVAVAKDGFKLEAEDPTAVFDLIGDIGSVVKSALALAASSSTTDAKIQVIFSQFQEGSTNYAIYYANNSMTVAASNAWGNKAITVVTSVYIIAKVKVNPDVTYEKMLQDDLDTLYKMNHNFDKAMQHVKSEEQFKALSWWKDAIKDMDKHIKRDRKRLHQSNENLRKLAEQL